MSIGCRREKNLKGLLLLPFLLSTSFFFLYWRRRESTPWAANAIQVPPVVLHLVGRKKKEKLSPHSFLRAHTASICYYS